jgi:isochorismate hydrolase
MQSPDGRALYAFWNEPDTRRQFANRLMFSAFDNEAADADYRLYVIKDCCADLDQELHACLVDKLFVRQATIVTADEFIDTLGSLQI